jgi:hypothetical protein
MLETEGASKWLIIIDCALIAGLMIAGLILVCLERTAEKIFGLAQPLPSNVRSTDSVSDLPAIERLLIDRWTFTWLQDF